MYTGKPFSVLVVGDCPEILLDRFCIKENPNPKGIYNWFELGGYWSGYFKAKEGGEGTLGHQIGFDLPDVKEGYYDAMFKKYIDFDSIKHTPPAIVIFRDKLFSSDEGADWESALNFFQYAPEETLFSLYHCMYSITQPEGQVIN